MIDQLFMQDLARDLAPPLEPVEQPATLLAAGPATSDVGQVTVQGYNEAKPSGVRVGRAGISPEQSAKAGGLDRPLVALLDTLAGALKGATAQTLGLPGDIRSILDLISQEGATKYLGEPVMPTTEQMQDILPAVVPQGVANQADREYTAKMASEIGTFLPAPGIPEAAVQGVKAVTKAVKATKGLPVGMSIQDVTGAEQVIEKAPKIESKAFKNWFGESKVVDESSKPIVVYHARRGDFESFDPLKSEGKSHGTGTFFSSSPDVAATYNTSSEHNLVPAYLSLKKPFVVDFNGANWNQGGSEALVKLPDGTDDDLLSYFGAAMDETVSTDDVARLAREQGYDGVIINNVVDHGPAGRFASKEAEKPTTIYVAFKPEQIKSVMNKGSFDPKDPRMLYGGAAVTVSGQQQEENK